MTRPVANPENGSSDAVGDSGFMRTASDRVVDPLALEVEDVTLLDIAQALSRQCRYNGHVGGFLSVARHGVWVAELLQEAGEPDEVVYAGLHHDDAEAYLGDIIRPMKYRPEMSAYLDIEKDAEAVIFEALGVTYPLPDAVRAADTLAGHLERAYRRADWQSTPEQDFGDWLMMHVSLAARLGLRHT